MPHPSDPPLPCDRNGPVFSTGASGVVAREVGNKIVHMAHGQKQGFQHPSLLTCFLGLGLHLLCTLGNAQALVFTPHFTACPGAGEALTLHCASHLHFPWRKI